MLSSLHDELHWCVVIDTTARRLLPLCEPRVSSRGLSEIQMWAGRVRLKTHPLGHPRRHAAFRVRHRPREGRRETRGVEDCVWPPFGPMLRNPDVACGPSWAHAHAYDAHADVCVTAPAATRQQKLLSSDGACGFRESNLTSTK